MAYIYIDVEAGLLNFLMSEVGLTAFYNMCLWLMISKCSDALKAFEAAATVIRGLVDRSVRAFY